MDAKAVYTGDSKRYHRYEIVGDDKIVGMIYLRKDSEIPKEVKLTTISKGHAEFKKLSEEFAAKKGR